MTVAATTRRAGPFAGNGVTISFPFAFKVFARTDVAVLTTDAAGVQTTLTLDSDYSILLNLDQDSNPGGTVTYPAVIGPPVLPTGASIVMIGSAPASQTTDLTNAGRFLPQVIENAFDKLTILVQQMEETLSRTLQAAVGTAVKLVFPTPSSGKFIRWRTDLTGLENADAGTDSMALQGFLADAADVTHGAQMIGFKVNTAGASGARTVRDKLTEFISVKDFGAIGNGAANDTVAIQNAVTAAIALKKPVFFPGGTYLISAPISIAGTGIELHGDGIAAVTLKPSGNFAALLSFASTAAYCRVTGMTFLTSGTTTKAVYMAVSSVVIRLDNCYFQGDHTGDLILSNGQNLDISNCTFFTAAAGTYGVNLDCYNQNTGITNCRFGGPGGGVRVTQVLTPSLNRVEGLKIVGTYFINTGFTNIEIGNSLFTTIVGSCLDQCTGYALSIQAGADNVIIDGCYLGSSATTTAIGVQISASAGRGHIISNNVFGFLGYGINVLATGAARTGGLVIEGNVFTSTLNPLLLDSVDGCIVANNNDTWTPTNGSWNTKATYGAGNYNFSCNRWHSSTPALFDAGSTYRFTNDLGIKGRSSGTQVAPSGTTLTINHGLVGTPRVVLVTLEGPVGTYSIATRTGTSFQVLWSIVGTPTVHWQAEL